MAENDGVVMALLALACVVVLPALIGGAIGYGLRGERSAGLAVLVGAVMGGMLGIVGIAFFAFFGAW